MIKFTLSGFDVCVTFGFLLIVSLLAVSDSPALGIAAVTACVIHELGHCFAAVIFNVKFKSLTLWAGGIQIKKEQRITSLKNEIIILICGPAFNITAAFLYLHYGMADACAVNLAAAIFNLLPYSSLDGGSIIKSVLEFYEKNTGFQKTLAIIFGITVIVFLAVTRNVSLSAVVTIALLTFNELIP